MKYLEFKPIEPLSDYIQLIWILESENSEDYYPREKILPDGIVEVIFHYRDPFVTSLSDGSKSIQPLGFAISQMRKFIEIESNGQIGFISIRFYPWGAYHFFNEPIKNFLDGTISLDRIWPKDYQNIISQLPKINDNEKVELIQDYLLDKLSVYKKDSKVTDDTIKLIRNTKGLLSVEELSEKSGLSYKQLERRFLSTLGTTPKIFSRISRFLHLCHNLKEYKSTSLSKLTYELGYFDQSHFIKEFKEFTSITPKEFFEKHNISFADI